MATLAIYHRLKKPVGWRFIRIEEAPGKRTGHLEVPFLIRPTQADGRQPWVKLDATTFDAAKTERDKRERGEIIAENNAGRTLLTNAVADFLDKKKRKNPSTVENYTYILNEFLGQVKARFVDEINHRVLDQYVTWLEEKNAAPKTINNKVMVVVFMLKAAGVTNPSKMVKDTLPTVEEEIAEPYHKKDLEKLFAAMESEEYVRYKFFLVTACREAEVAHAQWKDITVGADSCVHFVVQTKKFTTSNGKQSVFTPKSHERREIPITDELVDLLKERKKTSKSDWIFPNENGDPDGHFLRKFKKIAFEAGLNCGKCNSARTQGRFVKKTVEKNCATFSEGCSLHYLHRLRKTRATYWHTQTNNQVSLRNIQTYLGHKDLTTTQKYLGIRKSSEVMAAINKPMF